MTAVTDAPSASAREKLTAVVSPAGGRAERAAGVAALSVELDRLGREVQFLLLDDGGWPEPSAITIAAGHAVEIVAGSGGVGAALRTALGRARTELILRAPAVGLSFEFLKPLLSRINSGQVKPDIVVGLRPDRRLGAWGAVHRRVFRTVFGIVVDDPTSPVWLLRRRVLRESPPQCDGAFADFELLARANFAGHLLDELPLNSSWTGGPPPPADWKEMRRDAGRLLSEPNFVRRAPAAPRT